MSKKVLCCYHNKDLDGVASAALICQKYGIENVELFGWDYGMEENPLDKITNHHYRKVYVVDICFSINTMATLKQAFGLNFIWVDHHSTSIDSMKDIGMIYGLRKVGIAACALTWLWLYEPDPDKARELGLNHPDIPILIKYLAQYDVWAKEPQPWDNVLRVQYGARLKYGLSVEKLTESLIVQKACGVHYTTELHDDGRAILGYLKQKNANECEKYSFPCNIGKYKAIALNTLEFNSTTFDSIWDESKYDIMLAFAITPRGHVKCSIYSTKPEIHCGEIAKKLQGGGHKGAAGFISPIIPRKDLDLFGCLGDLGL